MAKSQEEIVRAEENVILYLCVRLGILGSDVGVLRGHSILLYHS
jgi:hypothetical protein